MKVSREVKTGVIAVLIIVLFIWGYNFLKDQSLTNQTRTFYAVYNSVEGLAKNSPVNINGLKVGKVVDIEFDKADPSKIVVHMDITNDITIPKNSIAQIYSPDLISGNALRINIANDGSAPLQNRDTLRGDIEFGLMGMLNDKMEPLLTKLDAFIKSADSVMVGVNKVLDDENQVRIKSSLSSLDQTLKHFKSLSADFDAIMTKNNGKIDSIIGNADHAMQKISVMADGLEQADLAATITKLQQTIDGFNRIIDEMERGEGTVGKLLKDEALYKNLSGASKQLEELLRDMKENPKRYVHFSLFGKKQKAYTPIDSAAVK